MVVHLKTSKDKPIHYKAYLIKQITRYHQPQVKFLQSLKQHLNFWHDRGQMAFHVIRVKVIWWHMLIRFRFFTFHYWVIGALEKTLDDKDDSNNGLSLYWTHDN